MMCVEGAEGLGEAWPHTGARSFAHLENEK